MEWGTYFQINPNIYSRISAIVSDVWHFSNASSPLLDGLPKTDRSGAQTKNQTKHITLQSLCSQLGPTILGKDGEKKL